MNKIYILLLSFLFVFGQLKAQKLSCSHKHSRLLQSSPNAAYSDTIDVISYKVNMDITNITGKIIVAETEVELTAKVNNLNSVKLDLLKLTIDSIKNLDGEHLNYTYNDTTITVNLPTALQTTDTIVLKISYKGNPKKDASGWGGWYWDNGYTYNLGVGFDANPHSYGRVWHPCLDNFVERATYEYYITTPIDQKAFCGGMLQEEITNSNNTKTWYWKQEHTVPAYLASIAMAKYATIQQVFNGINGAIPIEIGALPSDTNNVKNSFQNLHNCLETFEDKFGPYRWERIGYNMVPFSSGAMEHSCNITYPRVAAGGNLAYEDLMAHEIAHAWWGNLVTCDNAGEMWINEGNASYCEFLFFEGKYGRERYNTEMRSAHRSLLQFLHLNEGNIPISGVSHANTYSDHVYKKGADVIHTLRGYLGDSLYFEGSKAFLEANQYKDVNTQKYSDFLSDFSGIDCADFFNDWIRSPGWAGFSIDSFSVNTISANEYQVNFSVKQRLKGRNTYANNVPLEISFYDANWNKHKERIFTSGVSEYHLVVIPINAKLIIIDEDELINDAVTEGQRIIKNTGTTDFGNGLMSLNVISLSDSALVRVEHHWTAPDEIAINGITLSKSRFWKVSGILPSNFVANATMIYNGRTGAQSGTNFLDTWINIVEDSLKIFYRPDARTEWQVWTDYVQNKLTNSTDKNGNFVVNNIALGEYCVGIRNMAVNKIDNPETTKNTFSITPNPASQWIDIVFQGDKCFELLIYDISGKLMKADKMNLAKRVDISDLKPGSYFITVKDDIQIIKTEKLIVY
jgi:hypothetical protein